MPLCYYYYWHWYCYACSLSENSLKNQGSWMESSTPAQSRAFASVCKSAAFYSLQPVSVSVPHPWKFQPCLLHCICLGWHSGLNHVSVLTLQVGCVSPASLLGVQLWGGETGWCCNSRHCGLEAGTLLPIRIKWRTLALHFQHSVCLGLWSWAQCTVIIERVIQHFHSLLVHLGSLECCPKDIFYSGMCIYSCTW